MNTTIKISIGRASITIDSDAYDYLKDYLDDIASRIVDSSERYEVMKDVESRIAEIMIERGVSESIVASIVDVRHAADIIGPASIFGEKRGSGYSAPRELKRRLLRDVNHRVFGGVCSGIAAYFSCDIALIRVLLVIAILFLGTGLLLYIIAWVVIPRANSQEDYELLDRMREEKF